MRILQFGNFRHPWCTEVHLARELEALGHEVDQMQEPPGGGSLGIIRQMERRAVGVDLVLWTRTWGLPREATRMWRRLEANGIKTASYHLDLYVGLQREARVSSDPFWTTGHVFTPDGDPASARWFAEHGIRHHYIPPGVVTDEAVPGTHRAEFAHDVVFVGSPYEQYHPEWTHRRDLLAYLLATYGPRFHRYGQGDRTIRGQDLNDLYASAKVVVGDSLCLPGHVNYWSDRVYETVGRGGFLLHPRIPGLERHFTDGEHLRFYDYGDFDQVGNLIDKYLDDEPSRRAIAVAGQAHVVAHHTYRHRLAQALALL